MLAEQFAAFFNRTDSIALGVCNGCQMMANLAPIIPGAGAWPKFTRNQSEQYEGRLVTVQVEASPSIFYAGMEGSRIPIVVAHGEGYADFSQQGDIDKVAVGLRYVDNRGEVTQTYPLNPNGSPQGIASVTTHDGRFTALMPHPERVFRAVQMSWHPKEWEALGDGSSPWMRMFRNARKWMA
jgi:phosphoribosylformylglycinamidine synthase